MATDPTAYQLADTDNNLLRKMLTRLNGGLSVTGVSVAGVTVTNPVLISSASNVPIQFSDSSALDAFSRLRVATPTSVFGSQFTYNLAPLIYNAVTVNTGATITHDTTNRCALMTFAATPTGGSSYMQTFESWRYQPGMSQGIFASFNFIETTANCVKFVGYSDGVNGIELQQSDSVVQIALLSTTTLGNQIVTKANWNLDKLDGTGPSGLTLDLTKIQILMIDFQALYSGRVRVGFDLGGRIVYVHQFTHSNSAAFPYIQTANLPIRAGMTCTGTVSTTMRFICSSVVASGGVDDLTGYAFSAQGTVTAASGARTHILSLRPKTTFNSISNRIRFVFDSFEILTDGANSVIWELCIGQAISGTTAFTDVNTTYSGFEFNTAGTISGSPAIVAASGFCPATSGNKGVVSEKYINKYPITLDFAGAVRSLGTITALVTGVTGTSVGCRVAFNWHEIR